MRVEAKGAAGSDPGPPQPPPRDHGHSASPAPGSGLRARWSRGGRRRVTGEGDKTEQNRQGRYLLEGRRREMLREEAPGAQRRGSPLSWMEGERGEDRRPGAGRGGRSRPRNTGRLRRQPGRARPLEALGAGLRRHRPPRAHPSLCLLLAGEPRFRGAFSRQTLPGLLLRLPSPICRSLPSPGRPAPPGYPGSNPSSRPELVWAHRP